ncbi:DUF6263 family protein [Maribacter sp. 2307UL18-2]|uniref:DUF6263 family protein n=1 Tax=Maribacter sp. 2307UL18-2 TaxID=3386274 RepID=UPI0039BC3B9B
MKYTLAVLYIFFFSITLNGQTVLGYQLKKGDVFKVKQNAKQLITQELDGASHVLTNTLDGILEFTVIGESNDAYTIAFQFKDLNLLMDSSIQGELMNVRAKEVSEEDIQSKMFNSLLDQPVEMMLAKTGNILEVVGGDSLVAQMANSSGLEDEFSKNLMKKSLEKEFGSEALSSSYKQMTFIYSDHQVAVGDTWQNEYTGKLNAQNTWTLEALEDKTVTISGNADVTMDINEQATTMNLMGSQTTEITADRNTGFIEFMTVESEAKGVSTMAQLGDQEIPTTITSTITYKLIEE